MTADQAPEPRPILFVDASLDKSAPCQTLISALDLAKDYFRVSCFPVGRGNYNTDTALAIKQLTDYGQRCIVFHIVYHHPRQFKKKGFLYYLRPKKNKHGEANMNGCCCSCCAQKLFNDECCAEGNMCCKCLGGTECPDCVCSCCKDCWKDCFRDCLRCTFFKGLPGTIYKSLCGEFPNTDNVNQCFTPEQFDGYHTEGREMMESCLSDKYETGLLEHGRCGTSEGIELAVESVKNDLDGGGAEGEESVKMMMSL